MWHKEELAVAVVEGIAIHQGEKKKDYLARVDREKANQKQLTEQELNIKEYNSLKSICLSCKNAFVESYIDDPQAKDPTTCICKVKVQFRDIANTHYIFQCSSNNWARKTLNCSDYEERCI